MIFEIISLITCGFRKFQLNHVKLPEIQSSKMFSQKLTLVKQDFIKVFEIISLMTHGF